MARKPKRSANAKAASSPATTLIQRAFHVVCDMEDDVQAIEQFAHTLAIMAETFDDEGLGLAVQRVAWTIKARACSIEERRGNLFHSLHPGKVTS